MGDFLVGMVCGVTYRISRHLWLAIWIVAFIATGLQGWIPLYREYGTPPTALEFSWLFLLQRFAVVNAGVIVGYGFGDWVLRVVAEVRKEIKR